MGLITRLLDPRETWTVCFCGNGDGHKGPVWHPGQPMPPPNVRLVEAGKKEAIGRTKPKEVIFEVTVIRCGCGNPDSHNGVGGPAQPCPTPRSVVDRGRVAYYHRNPLLRLRWALYRRRRDRELAAQGE